MAAWISSGVLSRRRAMVGTFSFCNSPKQSWMIFQAMVFALALMVALVSRYNMTEMFSKDDFTMVKNPGKENMEIITKDGQKINRYTPSEDQSKKSGNKGKKVGIAYQLENGEIIYVPEDK